MAATRNENKHNVIADLQVRDAGSQFFDDARRFMAERHRHGPVVGHH